MKHTKQWAAGLTALALALGLLGCSAKGAKAGADDTCAAELVAEMTTEQKICQLLMPAFRYWSPTGDEADRTGVKVLNEEITASLTRHSYGGVILFRQNFADTAQTVALTTALQNATLAGGGLPLLIGTDQEGGMVVRLPEATTTAGGMALGAAGSTADAAATGRLMGRELKALGINVNFAPDMDVNANPQNPVIGVRSFGDDPALVARLGVAMLGGLQGEGVAAAVKHFPGHGNTATDSHIGLPLIDESLDTLRQSDLVPFAAAIDAGADLVMTAHIEYPQIETTPYHSTVSGEDITLPATLSHAILTDLLRGELGFDGVITTDSLVMDAIAKNFTPLEAATLALNAGADLLLMPVDTGSAAGLQALDELIDDLTAAVQAGTLDEAAVSRSAERVVALKLRRGIVGANAAATAEAAATTAETAARAEAAVAAVGTAENQAENRRIAGDAITVLQNHGELLPLNTAQKHTLVVAAAWQDELDAMLYGIRTLQDAGVVPADLEIRSGTYDDDAFDATMALLDGADALILDSNVNSWATMDPMDEKTGWQSGNVDALLWAAETRAVPTVMVSAALPYDAARHPNADAIVLAYCPRGISDFNADGTPAGVYGINLIAAMDIVFGAKKPVGTLPVSIPALNGDYAATGTVLFAAGRGMHRLHRSELLVPLLCTEGILMLLAAAWVIYRGRRK